MAQKKTNSKTAAKATTTTKNTDEKAVKETVVAEQKKNNDALTAEAKKDDEIALLKEQIALLKEQLAQTKQTPQIVTVSADSEKVHLLWQAEVADDNEITLGDNGLFGRITGKRGEVYVPKSELSRILTAQVREFLRRRWLLVLDGLTDAERESLGVDYKDDEVLTRKAFTKMLEMGDEIVALYPKLCDGHREMVQKRFYEAWQNGDKRVIRSVIVDLHNAAKEIGESNDTFGAILAGMNDKDAQ